MKIRIGKTTFRGGKKSIRKVVATIILSPIILIIALLLTTGLKTGLSAGWNWVKKDFAHHEAVNDKEIHERNKRMKGCIPEIKNGTIVNKCPEKLPEKWKLELLESAPKPTPKPKPAPQGPVAPKPAETSASPITKQKKVATKPVGKIRYGKASWYGPGFDGKVGACRGVRFDKEKVSAASPVLPCGTPVIITNLKNKRTIKVLIRDRGPYAINRMGKKRGAIPVFKENHLVPHPDRQFDLSEAAAEKLGYREDGTARIAYRVL
ncbi:MAG: septal ring lytic transglycosylase RlpA family protein [Patescibacteria group bacterium]|nr:septal ring lytic transglycosylase RlpA family protein [Patescibacteria group bacterium]